MWLVPDWNNEGRVPPPSHNLCSSFLTVLEVHPAQFDRLPADTLRLPKTIDLNLLECSPLRSGTVETWETGSRADSHHHQSLRSQNGYEGASSFVTLGRPRPVLRFAQVASSGAERSHLTEFRASSLFRHLNQFLSACFLNSSATWGVGLRG